MDDQTANERLALLLGWERVRLMEMSGWKRGSDATYVFIHGTPDFLHDWRRFPELQAYVRGLDELTLGMVGSDLMVRLGYADGPWPEALFDITPRILGMSILEVCVSDD